MRLQAVFLRKERSLSFEIMLKLPPHLYARIEERKTQNAYRQLRLSDDRLVDFCSNDYLGIVKNKYLQNSFDGYSSGSTGSRLLTGNSAFIEETEQKIATFHNAEAALLFNSGYDANMGIVSCVAQKGDTILYDSLCHASLRDGIRLSFAKAFSFLHNDVNDLRKKAKAATGAVFIITESVFSMDGDICPLQDILKVCSEFGAYLILDEAHAIGVIGDNGEGLAQHLQLHNEVWCRVYTFGKACGCHGAAAASSIELKNYLINFSRAFIYSTALPPHSIACIEKTYSVFPKLFEERKQIQTLIQQFQNATFSFQKQTSQTPVQAVIIEGNEEVKKASAKLHKHGLDIRPVLYPTVPKGSERLRIILHSFNKKNELDQLIYVLQTGW